MTAALTARYLSGRTPAPLLGRLLVDITRAGEVVALDPATGGELSTADDRPAFVLSSESEASDGHIVRQYWDLSRAAAGGPGVPVLWGHNQDRLLGQWQDLGVHDLSGPALVGRAWLDMGIPEAAERRGQIARGSLQAVSVGWMPGGATRRGDLDRADPLWRDAAEDECGQPAEGLVMGTEAQPNRLVECSLVACPADARAVVTERLYRGVARDLAAGGAALDLDRLLATLAGDSRVRSFLRAELARLVRDSLPGIVRDLAPTSPRRLVDILRS